MTLDYFGESFPADQHAMSAQRWQQHLGARWTIQEAWQTRCRQAVKLPPRVTPLVATKACTPRQLRPLLRNLARRHGILRYSAEMDWRYHGTPQAFIELWRRVYHAAHKRHVRVLWSATGLGMRTGRALAYWPGRRYVDLIGWTMLQWPYALRRVKNEPAARFAHRVHRRILIPELATSRSLPDRLRAWWLTRARVWLRRRRAVGVIYLNSAPAGEGTDWRLDGAPRATRAWRAMR